MLDCLIERGKGQFCPRNERIDTVSISYYPHLIIIIIIIIIIINLSYLMYGVS